MGYLSMVREVIKSIQIHKATLANAAIVIYESCNFKAGVGSRISH